MLSSMIQLIPGGRVRMKSLQFTVRQSWDHVDQTALVSWTPEIRLDLEWWLDCERLELGVTLDQVSPQLDLWSDASRGRGCFRPLVSRRVRFLNQCQRALRFFAPQIKNSSVAIFADNSTTVAYLRNQGGTRSLLNSIAQRILRWSEILPVQLTPQFIIGSHNVLADSLSRPNQVLGSEWTLKAEVFQELRRRWPVSIDLLATSLNHQCCPIFFTIPRSERSGYGCPAPELGWVAGVCLSTLVAHSDCSQEAPVVLWGPADHCRSLLASEAVVSGPSGSGGGRSGGSSSVQRPPASTTLPSSSSGSVRAVASYLETIQRFARARGFSKHVAQQAALARHPSSRAGYQAKWSVYRQWCHSVGHSVPCPSLSKIADFLFWLRRSKKLSVSAVLGYRSMLSAVFWTVLPEFSTSPIIRDLLRPFPCRSVRPPSWDLIKVLDYLRSPVFEPLSSASFLVALATAKRVGELQALSRIVSFSSSAAGLSYVPEFLAKTETAVRPLPRTFSIQSLRDFAAGLHEDLVLCPVRSLSEYVARTSKLVNRPRRLFVSPCCPSWAMSRNGISFFFFSYVK